MKNIIIIIIITAINIILAPVTFAAQATLGLSPTSGTFNRSCSFSLDVNLNTGGDSTGGTDAIILYNTSVFSATSISKGTIYSEYPGTNIDDSAGKITISGLASITQPFSGQGKLATVNFTVKGTAPTGTSQIKFDFDPSNPQKTTDSNVAAIENNAVAEILSSVTNGNYTVGTGTCSDTGSTGTGGSIGTGTGVGTGKGGVGEATPSGDIYKTLPPAGNEKFTFVLAILGSTLTILGILGLVIL